MPAASRRMWLCALAGLWLGTSAQAAEVVIVRSTASAKAAKLYDLAIDGLVQELGRPVAVIAMDGELAEAGALLEAVRAAEPKVVVAVGIKAAGVLRKGIGDLPLVLCMVSHTHQLKLKADNITGVTMQPSPADQLAAFRRVIPGLRRVGVLYHPRISGTFVQSARAAASGLGMQLIERPIEDLRQVPVALREVIEQSDGLWLLRDGKVVDQEFFTQSLLLQAERKLPLMVFSDRFVVRGALCSYSASYQSQGRRAARLVKALLSGTPAKDLPIQAPEGTLTINLTSAAKIGIQIPTELRSRPDVKTVGGQ